MDSTTTQPTSLREVAGTLFIYKWTIVLATLVSGGTALVVSLVQPEVYEASVQMLAQDQSPGLRGTSNYASDSAVRVKLILTNLREVLLSRPVLLTTLERAGLVDGGAAGDELDPAQTAAVDSRIEKLRKAVRIDAPKGSDYGATPNFFLRVRDKEPQVAHRLLTTLLEAFRERHEQLSAEQANHLLRETNLQLEKSREQLVAIEQQYQTFVEGLQGGLPELTSLSGSPGADSELRKALVSVNDALVPAEAALKAQQSFLEQMKQAHVQIGDPLVVPGAFIREYPGLEAAARELATVRLQMDSVAARQKPQHPNYQESLERLRLSEATYVEEIDRSIEGVSRDAAIKSASVEFLRQKREGYLRQLAQLADKYVEFEGLKEQLRQRRLIVESSEKRRSDAAHEVLTAAQEVLFSAVDSPRTSAHPVSPNRTTNIALGTLAGLLAGIGLAFLARHYSQTVRSDADLAGLVDRLPIVSVPRVRVPFVRAG